MLKILRRVCAALIIVSGLAGLSASAASPTGGIIRVKLQPEMARAVGKTARVRAASGDLLTGVTVLDAAARQVKTRVRDNDIQLGDITVRHELSGGRSLVA